jgi:hypothetical protein
MQAFFLRRGSIPWRLQRSYEILTGLRLIASRKSEPSLVLGSAKCAARLAPSAKRLRRFLSSARRTTAWFPVNRKDRSTFERIMNRGIVAAKIHFSQLPSCPSRKWRGSYFQPTGERRSTRTPASHNMTSISHVLIGTRTKRGKSSTFFLVPNCPRLRRFFPSPIECRSKTFAGLLE